MESKKQKLARDADIAANFKTLQERFNEGARSAALHALAHAYYFRVMPPKWAIEHVADGYGRWSKAEVKTLDEALGIQRPKGFRLDAVNRSLMHGGMILIDVNKRLETEPYDDEIFEDAGKKWGIGKTAAKDIYYSEMDYLKLNHPETYAGILSSREKSRKAAGLKR